MALRYEATIVYVVYQDDEDFEDDDDERLWASGSSLAKALENYSGDSAGQINVETANVVALGEVADDD